MVKYQCPNCFKEFKQKSHYVQHQRRKNPCVAPVCININGVKELHNVLEFLHTRVDVLDEMITNSRRVSSAPGAKGLVKV